MMGDKVFRIAYKVIPAWAVTGFLGVVASCIFPMSPIVFTVVVVNYIVGLILMVLLALNMR